MSFQKRIGPLNATTHCCAPASREGERTHQEITTRESRRGFAAAGTKYRKSDKAAAISARAVSARDLQIMAAALA